MIFGEQQAVKAARRLWFQFLTSLICSSLAMVFFFWADCRIGVGFVLLWLAGFSTDAAIKAFIAGFEHAKGGQK